MKAKGNTETQNRGKSKASKMSGRVSRGRPAKAKQALPITPAQIAKLLERISDGFVALDKNWRYVYVNQKGAEMLQRQRPSDLIGKHIWTEYPEGVGQPFQLAYERAMKEQVSIVIEDYYEPWDRWFENRIYPSTDILCILFTEITERKRVEAALRESEQKFSKIFYASPVPVSINRVSDGRYVEVNQSFLKRMGYKREELIGRTALEIAAWLDPARRPEMLDILHDQGSLSEFEAKFRTKSGEVGTALLFREIIELAGEKHFIGTTLDITERKQVEEALRESEQRYRILTEASHDMVVLINRQFEVEYTNTFAASQFGITPREFTGKRIFDFFTPDIAARQQVNLQRVFEGEQPAYVEAPVVFDGRTAWLGSWLVPIRDAADQVQTVLIISRDITDRKHAEESASASEAELRALFASMNDVVLVIDRNGTYLKIAPTNPNLLYKPSEELLGKTLQQVFPNYLAKTFMSAIHQVLETRQTIQIEYQFAIGDRVVWFESSIAPMDADNTLWVARDVTERKQADEKIQVQVRHLSALHEIDQVISASVDLRVTLDLFLKQAVPQLKADAAAILLFNPGTLTLEYTAGHGFPVMRQAQIRLDESYAGRAVLERNMIHIPNFMQTDNKLAQSRFLANESFVDYYAVPLMVKGQVKGVLEIFHRAQIQLELGWLNFLETLAGQAAIAIDNAQLFDDLQRSNMDLSLAYDATIEGWSRAMDLRDKETEGHTLRVTDLTLELARAMSIDDSELMHIRRGALLHDIGKLGIPDHILLKSHDLTDEEWVVMHKHPIYAYEMLSSITYLRPALDIPYAHHEKWDGTGYPRELEGEQIPLAARIFAIVDVWDAITSDRPYRAAWSKEKAIEYIQEQSGKHFDPKVVEAFLIMIANQ